MSQDDASAIATVGLWLWQVIVSLEEAAAVNCTQHHLAIVRILFDFRPQSSYEMRLRKVHFIAKFLVPLRCGSVNSIPYFSVFFSFSVSG